MSFEEIRRQALDFIGRLPDNRYRPGDVVQVVETVPLETYRMGAYRLTEADINSVYGRAISFNNWQSTTASWSTTANAHIWPYDPVPSQPEAKVEPKVGKYKQFKLTKDGMSH